MPKRKSLMRSLGEFFGHISRGVKADVDDPERHEVRREVEEHETDAPPELGGGKMTIRRTTIDEIEVDRE